MEKADKAKQTIVHEAIASYLVDVHKVCIDISKEELERIIISDNLLSKEKLVDYDKFNYYQKAVIDEFISENYSLDYVISSIHFEVVYLLKVREINKA